MGFPIDILSTEVRGGHATGSEEKEIREGFSGSVEQHVQRP